MILVKIFYLKGLFYGTCFAMILVVFPVCPIPGRAKCFRYPTMQSNPPPNPWNSLWLFPKRSCRLSSTYFHSLCLSPSSVFLWQDDALNHDISTPVVLEVSLHFYTQVWQDLATWVLRDGLGDRGTVWWLPNSSSVYGKNSGYWINAIEIWRVWSENV